MSDETKPDQLPMTEDENVTPLDVVTDLVLDSTIPAPIRKGAFKAFGQLCTALIDVPLGGLRRRDAEKWAETEARIKIIGENADQIAQQMNVPPEYAKRAGNKFAEKIIREQINLDKTSAIAANELKKENFDSSAEQSADSDEEKIINDDWLNSFEEEARQKRSEDMRLLFGRILAGEIRKPGRYSIRTVRILGQLDQNAATLFKRLCSVSAGLIDSASGNIISFKAISLENNPLSSHTLEKYGLSASVLNTLQEYGLTLDSDFMCWHFQKPYCGLRHQGRNWIVSPLPGNKEENQELNLYGIQFTSVARELFGLVDQDPMPEYTEDLKEFLAQQNLQMREVNIKNRT